MSALCGSRRELSNAYLLAKIGVDTAENEPLEVWGENSIQYSLHSLGAIPRRSEAPLADGPHADKNPQGQNESHSDGDRHCRWQGGMRKGDL